MRKILLATTALVALTGAAQAAESPITVTVGGYVDFRAALFHETSKETYTDGAKRTEGEFETEYRINIDAAGKAARGIEYGAHVSLWNGEEGTTEAAYADEAYIYMSGAMGKVLFGDAHGASDLFVYAPTVGEGQFDGTYTSFTDGTTMTEFLASYVDNTENSTKIAYYTPKVGNANHKVQLGVSYAPNDGSEGHDVPNYLTGAGNYRDATKLAAQYTGNFSPVNVVFSAKTDMARKNSHAVTVINSTSYTARDYMTWGLGTQATYAGITLGGSYVDGGHAGTTVGQDKVQSTWTLGVKYEFDKVALAANYLNGRGYNNSFDGTIAGYSDTTMRNVNYVNNFNAYGIGATYTWFPGLTTAADGMLLQQKRADHAASGAAYGNNDGYVMMLSQKMAF